MLTGTIKNIEPPDSKDQYDSQYQYITIAEQATNKQVRGRIGSKAGYTKENIGQLITVNVERKQSKQGPYLYFKRLQEQQQQSSQQAVGDMVHIRSMALAYVKDLVCGDKVPYVNLQSETNKFTAYIMAGRWLDETPAQKQQDDSQWIDDSQQDDSQWVDKSQPDNSDVPF